MKSFVVLDSLKLLSYQEKSFVLVTSAKELVKS